jgi:hypothetical protein
MRISFCFVLVALLFTGCATKQTLLVDGVPLPTTEYVERNPANNMRIEAKITQFKWEKPEDEKKGREWLYPFANIQINNDKVQELEKEAVHIGWTLRVVNPNREKYSLGAQYVIVYPSGKKRKTYKVFYEGDPRDKIFHLGKDVEETRPEVSCVVFIYTNKDENDFEITVKYNEEGDVK